MELLPFSLLVENRPAGFPGGSEMIHRGAEYWQIVVWRGGHCREGALLLPSAKPQLVRRIDRKNG